MFLAGRGGDSLSQIRQGDSFLLLALHDSMMPGRVCVCRQFRKKASRRRRNSSATGAQRQIIASSSLCSGWVVVALPRGSSTSLSSSFLDAMREAEQAPGMPPTGSAKRSLASDSHWRICFLHVCLNREAQNHEEELQHFKHGISERLPLRTSILRLYFCHHLFCLCFMAFKIQDHHTCLHNLFEIYSFS